MTDQQFTALVKRSRAGDSAARKKLLIESYLRISYQCRHILLNQSVAETVTREILRILNEEVDSPLPAKEFTERLQGLLAERMIQRNHHNVRRTKPIQPIGKLLDECQTAELVVSMVETLPWEERLCAFLVSCGEMEVESISAHTGLSETKIRESLEKAEEALNSQLQQFREQGIKLLGLGRMELMLSSAMAENRNEMTAAAVAETIMGSIRPKKLPCARRKRTTGRKAKKQTGLIAAIIVLLAALLAAISFALTL